LINSRKEIYKKPEIAADSAWRSDTRKRYLMYFETVGTGFFGKVVVTIRDQEDSLNIPGSELVRYVE
jgi:hypothetical protein